MATHIFAPHLPSWSGIQGDKLAQGVTWEQLLTLVASSNDISYPDESFVVNLFTVLEAAVERGEVVYHLDKHGHYGYRQRLYFKP